MSIPIIFEYQLPRDGKIHAVNQYVEFQTPINLDLRRRQYIECRRLLVPNSCQNICEPYHNNILVIKLSNTNGDDEQIDIMLPNGRYQFKQIEGAINSALLSHLTDPSDFGILIDANSVLNKIYITLLASKFKPFGGFDCDVITIEPSKEMRSLLGFSESQNIQGTNGAVIVGELYARLNFFGNNLHVYVESFNNTTILNSETSTLMCVADIDSSMGQLNIVYPKYGERPIKSQCFSDGSIRGYRLKLCGIDESQLLYFTGDGSKIYVELILSEK